MESWKAGDLDELLREGRTIQARIPKGHVPYDQGKLARQFSNNMCQGKTKVALCLLHKQSRGGVLHLEDFTDVSGERKSVREVLSDKHPPSQPAHPYTITSGVPPEVHPVLFESLYATIIRSAALHVSGAAGPSGLDALSWRRMCTCFKAASHDLCHALALTAKRLCTELVDPASIATLMSSRLIALDKNPGVRPIGIGDTARRIIAKAILFVTRHDIQEATGSIQLCVGLIAGVEAAVHVM